MNRGNEMKMKKWSSLWTQFMQLSKDAWKKIQDCNGVWSRDLAITGAMLYHGAELWSHWRWEQVVHCDDHFFIFISFRQFIHDLLHISLTLISFTGTYEPTIDLLPTSVAS